MPVPDLKITDPAPERTGPIYDVVVMSPSNTIRCIGHTDRVGATLTSVEVSLDSPTTPHTVIPNGVTFTVPSMRCNAGKRTVTAIGTYTAAPTPENVSNVFIALPRTHFATIRGVTNGAGCKPAGTCNCDKANVTDRPLVYNDATGLWTGLIDPGIGAQNEFKLATLNIPARGNTVDVTFTITSDTGTLVTYKKTGWNYAYPIALAKVSAEKICDWAAATVTITEL